jgi:hypothetical protein
VIVQNTTKHVDNRPLELEMCVQCTLLVCTLLQETYAVQAVGVGEHSTWSVHIALSYFSKHYLTPHSGMSPPMTHTRELVETVKSKVMYSKECRTGQSDSVARGAEPTINRNTDCIGAECERQHYNAGAGRQAAGYGV